FAAGSLPPSLRSEGQRAEPGEKGLGLTELSARRRWARARVQLAGPEASHQLRPRQQLLEGAPIDDPPAVHEQDLVGSLQGSPAMGDHETGHLPSLHETPPELGLGVEVE